jgi:hypothetical protein
MKQYPHVYKFKTKDAVGVKTYIGDQQYGEVTAISGVLNQNQYLEKAEADLRASVARMEATQI